MISKITPSNQAYFYHFDGLGSTVAMSDSTGAIVNKYAYDEYGNLLNSQEAVPNPFRYVGQSGVMDDGNGLLYMRARYYDSDLGRFIGEDPVWYSSTESNFYMYVANNPINHIDPSGLTWLEYDPRRNIIYVHPGGPDTQGPALGFPAANNASCKWAPGMYGHSGYRRHPESGPNDGFGSYGIHYFGVPNRTWIGVHSGRANQGGPSHATLGCIRTTDEGMKYINDRHWGGDPIDYIFVGW